jgi:hypothetical protein
MFSETFHALLKEAEFTKEMLGAGATQIRKANYATKGIYFQAFTSLSTGIERIGKLCIMLDYYIEHNEQFPSPDYMQNKIRHKILMIYEQTLSIIKRRNIKMEYLQNLDDPIHQEILRILADFAQGDRYSNINILLGAKPQKDPVADWYKKIDLPLFGTHVSVKKRTVVAGNAKMVAKMLEPHSTVLHFGEDGGLITDMEESSFRTGLQEAVAPFRQLYVMQVIRFWVELLWSLQHSAMNDGSNDIPGFGEIFALFFNDDSYIKTRRAWDRLR